MVRLKGGIKIKTIELQVGEIKSNPFKKYISNGKLDEERLQKMEESLTHGTLPLSFTVREKNGGFELSSGHHRIAAIKRKKGKDFKVSINIVDYSDELMLVDMIRENLTQRGSDFHDVEDRMLKQSKRLQVGKKEYIAKGKGFIVSPVTEYMKLVKQEKDKVEKWTQRIVVFLSLHWLL